ncbi:MAG: FAD-binding oxidoreductase [Gammaproteobacteria bacterium]|nr:FAD-binding oxidoreductase [Gammaproteobacteria bacterium]
MASPTHIDSYYAATAHPWELSPVLRGAETCDVCVIGGGITGCSAALHLAQRGFKVILLEGQRIGWGASGRSGAQVIPGFARDIDVLATQVGAQDACRLWEMSVAAVHLVKELIEAHTIDCEWQAGQMHVAIKPRQARSLKATQALLAETYDYPLRYLEGEEFHTLLRSPRYIGGLLDHQAGHVHPLNYTLGLAAAARKEGVRIFEASAVSRYDVGQTPIAYTAEGQVNAGQLVFAGNAYLGKLVPALSRKIMPVGTYIAATAPLGERAASVITNNMAVTDINFVLDYFRLSGDKRLLFGGRVSYSTVPPPNLKATMRARLVQVFPQLHDVKIDHAWGGYVDISFNRAPHIGRLNPNVYFAQGFSGHGMALTGFAGKLIAEAIAGTNERFDVFARIQHRDFPGGTLFRLPALWLGTFYYRLRDLL